MAGPPLIINENQIDELVTLLTEAVEATDFNSQDMIR
jgi:adenosylmethionine-8-amino-7-oxononanoate aminotransferase